MECVSSDLRIYGKQVYLRPITVEDTDMVVGWRNSDEVVRNFIYRKKITPGEHMDWLEKMVEKGLVHQFIVCLNNDNAPVGSVYLQHFELENKKAESGIFLGTDSPKGKGIGTEAVLLLKGYAFEDLGLHKLVARVLSYNTASVRLHEKAGYTKEAYLKDELYLDGKYEDLILFGAINPSCSEEI